jgi:hypothetical protein
MTGMCSRCHNDASVPDGDLCRSCLDLEQEALEYANKVVHLTRRNLVCQFGHAACTEQNPCPDCVEFAYFGRDDAA